MSKFSVQVPLRITVEIDSSSLEPMATGASAASSTATEAGLERISIDPNYRNRRGYDPDFLGAPVPLPTLTETQRDNAAKNARAKAGADPTVLPYHHFSIVMNRRRQLAYYTAVNIDGASARQPPRASDKWSFDPRIAESEQIGEDLYLRNDLDRGHLVRRLDPAWGSASEALRANDDTFHFTNCSPQHAQFNQNDETWQGIENYLLGQATGEGKRITIFTGPVMAEDDPLYRGVRLPLHFWKIAVYPGTGGQLAASAYLLSQASLLDGLERFNPGTFQVEIEEIISRTGLDFSHIAPHSVKLTSAEGLERIGDMPRRRLESVDDIVAY